MGYSLAGFDVTGVDNKNQPRYPFTFLQGDAMTYLAKHGQEYDLIHASPPCQKYSHAQRIRNNKHPDYINPLRELLIATGKPYVIENVVGAPLNDPLELCGSMFKLRTYRHRIFETNFPVSAMHHPRHMAPITKMGRVVQPGEYMHIVGNFIGADLAREIMGMPWASRAGLREAIPPAYTAYIGRAALAALQRP
nr:SAM-dependent methyltransferase [Kitasatospora sp. MBT66]